AFGTACARCLSHFTRKACLPCYPVAEREVAPRVGFEPTAIRLTVECSTAELSGSSPGGQGSAYMSGGRVCQPCPEPVEGPLSCAKSYSANCSATMRSLSAWPGSNSS